ncbi:hypothetical protein SDC9_123000 [bioreactor metagenome]|uniref:Uncharacterized protein n=1 Tax=bioreactor metagenome TaxID=1076179 RepID=A0A645CGF8_9ZZZZ
MLIVQYTDSQEHKELLPPYINYLTAKAMYSENTSVELFEEGDYEVALNYRIAEDKLMGKNESYRISIKFKVRNSDCMIFLKELTTNRILEDSATTKYGFELDLAKSRYLNVVVMGESLEGGRTFLNGAAKDGSKYTDEGIYTITAKNEYVENTEYTMRIVVRAE